MQEQDTVLSPVKQALVEIRRMKEELAAERRGRTEPIAIVGMGLRFPGADSPAALARLLYDGVDATRPVPRDRWAHDRIFDSNPDAPGKCYVDRGGFLENIDGFDPEFFGIAPLEAVTMDPQQRLLLETAWEALEHAGIAATTLRGTRAGVFLGMATSDYARLVLARPGQLDGYASSGTAFSVAAGRLSYLFGMHGPALAVDTACSGSLVATHLAMRSLRSGESDIALAGGVSLMLTPETTINFCRAGMLAPDGHCKTFDAAADGYVRSEGCGIVVLKRLSDAERAGDRVLAVLRGSAVNQDGRSSGLTAPSGPAQVAVIRAALADAGLGPADIDYVEAHGTGTSLGDPIEVQALGEVFGGSRTADRPLLIGSIKTNLGHLEAAAGVAGLIKAVIAVRDGGVPPHLHLETPNPHIPWAELPIEVPTTCTPLMAAAGPRRAGVSSFGFSGTNAHVIVEEAKPGGEANGGEESLLVLSAPNDAALRRVVLRWAEYLHATSDAFADVCAVAAAGRTRFAHRLVVESPDAPSAARALDAWLEGDPVDGLRTGVAGTDRPTLAFVFGGDADASVSPDPDLVDRFPAFAEALAQPGENPAAGSAIRHALAEALRSLGIEPEVVIESGTGPDAHETITGVLDKEGVDIVLHFGHGTSAGNRTTIVVTPTVQSMLSALATLHVAGVDFDPSAIGGQRSRVRTAPPTYPFNRRRIWLPDAPAAAASPVLSLPDPYPWEACIAAALERAALAPIDVSVASYGEKWQALAALSRVLGRNALADLGAFRDPDVVLDVDDVLAASDILATYRPIIARWLDGLAEDGLLLHTADGFRPATALSLADVSPTWARVETALADEPALLRYVRNATADLANVLTGRAPALETLFPGGSFELAEALYEGMGALRYVNGIAARALEAWLGSTPGSAIRVLEVGGGTGGTTASILPVLPPGSDYTFTDVSDVFLDFAKAKFADAPVPFRTALLDLERDPIGQGFETGFDVVIGANVLHATRDLPQALRRVRSLLRPGGLLVMVESTGHHEWHDITTGLIEGWQRFEDDLRTDTPLLSVPQWKSALERAGFADADAAPPAGSPAGVLRQHVILARTSGAGSAAPARGLETGVVKPVPAARATEAMPFAAQLAGAIGAEREERATAIVRECVMGVLRSDPERPPSRDARLLDLGLDSLMAVRLRNVLQARLGEGVSLPATLVFDFPTIRHIARLLLSTLEAGTPSSPPLTRPPGREGARSTAGRESAVAAMSDDEVAALLLDRFSSGD